MSTLEKGESYLNQKLSTIDRLCTEPEIQAILKLNPIEKLFLKDHKIAELLEDGDLTVDLDSLSSEIQLLYAVLLDTKQDDGSFNVTRAVSVLKALIDAKKTNRDLAHRAQIDEQTFRAFYNTFYDSLGFIIAKHLGDYIPNPGIVENLTKAIIQDVLETFINPRIQAGIIPENVIEI